MRRRRRFTRSFAGKKGSRRFFWFRFTPFGLTLREAATATHSDILLQESDYYDPNATLNDAQRGGPRLERLIVQYGLSVDAASNFWTASSSANIALIPEFMIATQSDAFATLVTSSTSFDAVRANQRVLMDQIPFERGWTQYDQGVSDFSIRTVQGEYETKSKVRLADKALSISWRGLFDTATGSLQGYTDWVRPTMLISLP